MSQKRSERSLGPNRRVLEAPPNMKMEISLVRANIQTHAEHGNTIGVVCKSLLMLFDKLKQRCKNNFNYKNVNG